MIETRKDCINRCLIAVSKAVVNLFLAVHVHKILKPIVQS